MVTVCRLGGWTTFEAFWSVYAHMFGLELVMVQVKQRMVQNSLEHSEVAIICVSEFPSTGECDDELLPSPEPACNTSSAPHHVVIEELDSEEEES